jgi:glycosyltransferase involved in cell wall biosynthesis
VSVVIAASNAERTIAETLASIAAQTFRDFEVIVVDDGSTDRTGEIVAESAAGLPQWTCLRRSNGGQPAARNTGIQAARGRYVAFVDADDLWMPEKLEKQVRRLDAHPRTGLVYTDTEIFDGATGRTLGRASDKCGFYEGDVLKPLLLRCFIQSPTPMVRRAVFDDVGLFDEARGFEMAEDWPMWLRIAARWRVDVVREPLARYRVHATGQTRTASVETTLRARRLVVERAIERDPDRLMGLRSKAVAELEISAGLRYLRLGKLSEARARFAAALRERPWNLVSCFYLASAFLPGALLAGMNRWREAH